MKITPALADLPTLLTTETLLAAASGLAISLFSIVLLRALSRLPAPAERPWREPPPLAFRLGWWPLQMLARLLRPGLPAALEQTLQRRLRLAGLAASLDAAHFVAACLLWSATAAAIASWLAGSFAFRSTWPAAGAALLGLLLPLAWLRDRQLRRQLRTLASLPFMLELITLGIEAGLSLHSALAHALGKAPPSPLRGALQQLLLDIRAGHSRPQAWRALAQSFELAPVNNLVSSLLQAETSGLSLAPMLRAQAEQLRNARFAAAEKQAMQAPVKMLLPLLVFILPAVFIILLYPVAMKLLALGL